MFRWLMCLAFSLLASCVSTTPAPETTASAESSARSHRVSWPVAGESEPFEARPSQICSTDFAPSARGSLYTIDVEVPPQDRPVSFIPWVLHEGGEDEPFLMDQTYAAPSAEPIRCRLTVMPLDMHEGGTTFPNAMHIGLAHSVEEGGWSFHAMCDGARFWVNGREVEAEILAPLDPEYCVYRLPDPAAGS